MLRLYKLSPLSLQKPTTTECDYGLLLGFGSSFIRRVKLLYNKISCRITYNNDLADYFFPSRGVRQVCPLSPLLYVIIAEVLGCNIRGSQFIDGFKLPGGPIFKLS